MSKHLLVVEDSADELFFLERACKRACVEFAIHWVKGTQEAIQYLEGDGEYSDRERFPMPDAVLLDLKMPGSNGFDFLEWRSLHPKWKALPVIVFTSSKLPDDLRRCYELGANSFITKPRPDERLVAIVEALEDWWMKRNQTLKLD